MPHACRDGLRYSERVRGMAKVEMLVAQHVAGHPDFNPVSTNASRFVQRLFERALPLADAKDC